MKEGNSNCLSASREGGREEGTPPAYIIVNFTAVKRKRGRDGGREIRDVSLMAARAINPSIVIHRRRICKGRQKKYIYGISYIFIIHYTFL